MFMGPQAWSWGGGCKDYKEPGRQKRKAADLQLTASEGVGKGECAPRQLLHVS